MLRRNLFILLSLACLACSSESKVSSGPLEELPPPPPEVELPTSTEGDTSQYEAPILDRPTESMPSEMIGSWQAVELRIGDFIMTNTDMEEQGITPPIRYFSRNKYMQFGAPSGELPRIPFTYFQGELHSQDQGKEQVLYLGADTLILSSDIDGETSTYTFVKVK